VSDRVELPKRIYVAGHRGLVGSAIIRALHEAGRDEVVTATRKELDLCDAAAVEAFVKANKPDAIVIAAAKVGGIYANNTFPADFIMENLAVAVNLVGSAFKNEIPRVLFLGSSCIYPRLAPQPMKEEALLSGALEPTNEPYAVAKIAGLKICQSYRRQHGVMYHSAMPTNLYGPHDNYHPKNSHVLPALLRRFHEAKTAGSPDVTLWGTGEPKREFMHVDDLAAAVLFLLKMENPPDWVNVGTGEDVRIKDAAEIIRKVTAFKGDLKFDTTKPDGAPRKLLDVSLMRGLGWTAKIGLAEGLAKTYDSFLQELESGILRES
jgi:GDP-L-fucose synthase